MFYMDFFGGATRNRTEVGGFAEQATKNIIFKTMTFKA
jgi:hypothetical protein